MKINNTLFVAQPQDVMIPTDPIRVSGGTTKSTTGEKSGFTEIATAISEAFCYVPCQQSKGGKSEDSWFLALARAMGKLADSK